MAASRSMSDSVVMTASVPFSERAATPGGAADQVGGPLVAVLAEADREHTGDRK